MCVFNKRVCIVKDIVKDARVTKMKFEIRKNSITNLDKMDIMYTHTNLY